MKKEDAEKKVCPIMSRPNVHLDRSMMEYQFCFTTNCMAWRETINSAYELSGRCMLIERDE